MHVPARITAVAACLVQDVSGVVMGDHFVGQRQSAMAMLCYCSKSEIVRNLKQVASIYYFHGLGLIASTMTYVTLLRLKRLKVFFED